MASNSFSRRLVKRALAPLMSEGTYSVIQAAAMGWDIRQRTWFEPEIELIDACVREGETIVDIGANFGLWAYYGSKAVGKSGRVYSFEPIPFTARTFRLIAQGLRFAHNTELVEKGCGERNEKVTFTVPVMETGAISAGLVHMKGRNDDRPGKDTFAKFQKTKDVTCDVVRVDDYLAQDSARASRVSLLKCDVEGADLYALRGAQKTIEQNKPVAIVEITPWFLDGFGLKVEDITGFFEGLGYLCYRYENKKLFLTAPDKIVEDNWVFVHPENAERLKSFLP